MSPTRAPAAAGWDRPLPHVPPPNKKSSYSHAEEGQAVRDTLPSMSHSSRSIGRPIDGIYEHSGDRMLPLEVRYSRHSPQWQDPEGTAPYSPRDDRSVPELDDFHPRVHDGRFLRGEMPSPWFYDRAYAEHLEMNYFQMRDQTRFLKRREQNRTAQRAFRDRKEKHVKDLEGKVATLGTEIASKRLENDRLRSQLSRLQAENLLLRQLRNVAGDPSPEESGSFVDPEARFSTGPFDSLGITSGLLVKTSEPTTSFSPPMPPFTYNYGQLEDDSWALIASAPEFTSFRDPSYERLFGTRGPLKRSS